MTEDAISEHQRGLHLDHAAEGCDACAAERGLALAADPLNPSMAVLAKLGSLVVHSQEARTHEGHTMDVLAITSILSDPEVEAWVKAMQEKALVPVRRG